VNVIAKLELEIDSDEARLAFRAAVKKLCQGMTTMRGSIWTALPPPGGKKSSV
jgi:hypothetical protein